MESRRSPFLTELCNNTCMHSNRCEVHPLHYQIENKNFHNPDSLTPNERGSTGIASSYKRECGENGRSEMWRSNLFPGEVLCSQVEAGGGSQECLHQSSRASGSASAANSGWRLFPFGTKVRALDQAVPWKLLKSCQLLTSRLSPASSSPSPCGSQPGFQECHTQN